MNKTPFKDQALKDLYAEFLKNSGTVVDKNFTLEEPLTFPGYCAARFIDRRNRSDSRLILRASLLGVFYCFLIPFLISMVFGLLKAGLMAAIHKDPFQFDYLWSISKLILPNTDLKNPEGKDTFSNFFQFIVFLLGGFSVTYWNLKTRMGEQWNYCADLYNRVFLDGIEDPPLRRAYKKISLAIDIIDLDLWSHKSFRKVVSHSLELALLYRKRLDSLSECPRSEEHQNSSMEIARLEKGACSLKFARSLLGNLQNDLELYILFSDQAKPEVEDLKTRRTRLPSGQKRA